MVVSKAELKKIARDDLKMRVAAKALDLLKNSLEDQETAVKVLKAAGKLAKDLKKGTVLESHVAGVLAGFHLGEKKM